MTAPDLNSPMHCEEHPELEWPHDECAGPGMWLSPERLANIAATADSRYVFIGSQPERDLYAVEIGGGEWVIMVGDPVNGDPLVRSDGDGDAEPSIFTAERAANFIRHYKSKVPFCCHPDCPLDADFLVRTVRDGGGVAGPDIYSDDTHACEAHVGYLLGMQPDCRDPELLGGASPVL